MNPLYPDVAQRAGEQCEYCRAPEWVFNFAFEVEHVLPRAASGDDAPDNLGSTRAGIAGTSISASTARRARSKA